MRLRDDWGLLGNQQDRCEAAETPVLCDCESDIDHQLRTANALADIHPPTCQWVKLGSGGRQVSREWRLRSLKTLPEPGDEGWHPHR